MKCRHPRILASLLLAATLACHDAPTEPRTPISALDLDGKWTGTITYDTPGNPGCPLSEAFETTIAMNGGEFAFPVHTQCRSTLILDGRIVSDLAQANLMVEVDGQDEDKIVTLGGSAANTRIEASARNTARSYHGPISLLMTR